VVGGTGVALPLSYLGELLSRSSQALHIKIVWAVREGAFLMTILRDFHSLLGDERVEMEVHITRDDECPDRVLDMDLGNVTQT
jgi:hypothetical protein